MTDGEGDSSASTASTAKRRRLAGPSSGSALNWNQGVKQSNLRTSLVRTLVSSGGVDSGEPTAASADADAEADASPSENTSSKAPGPADGEAQQADSAPVDEENDSLYDEPEQPASARGHPGSKAPGPVVSLSDDDSDILQLHTDDELDQGVMINLSGDHEEAMPNGGYHAGHAAYRSAPHESTSPDEGEIQSSAYSPSPAAEDVDEDDDAMHRYADASGPPSLTLGDLSLRDLRLQLRYFFLLRSPNTIPLSTPARCLVCTAPSHLAATCPATVCSHCTSPAHFSASCPTLLPCPRCQQTGHAATACKAKLKALPDETRPCVLCRRPGHGEADCEVRWRSSAMAQWAADLPEAGVRRECYECGRAGHLGNDCPTRQPGKPLGSSAWSSRPTTAPPHGPTRPVGLAHRDPAPKPRGGSHFRYRSPPARNRSATRSRSRSPGAFVRHGPPRKPRGARGGRAAKEGRIQIRGMAGRSELGGDAAAAGRGKPAVGRGSGKKGPLPANRGARGGPARGAGAAGRGRGGGESYRPLPGAAARAWSKGFT